MRGVWNNLTDEQQANLAKTIAGTNQFSALQTIMSGLSDEAIASGMSFSDYSEALQNCDGTASDMAATMQDNLLGRLTQLKSKLEDVGITIGNSLMPFMEKAVAKIGELADKFAALSPQQQETILKVAGVVAAIGPADDSRKSYQRIWTVIIRNRKSCRQVGDNGNDSIRSNRRHGCPEGHLQQSHRQSELRSRRSQQSQQS